MPEFSSSVLKSYPVGTSDLSLADVSATTKALIRAPRGSDAAAALGVAFGSSRVVDGTLVVGIRPTEWLVLGPEDAVWSFADAIDSTGHVSKINFTHGRALFRITGEQSPRVLEKICSLDWADNMMPDGAATSASVAKVTCDIVRNDALPNGTEGVRSYFLASDRSSGQYLFDAIIDAGDEFNIGVVPG